MVFRELSRNICLKIKSSNDYKMGPDTEYNFCKFLFYTFLQYHFYVFREVLDAFLHPLVVFFELNLTVVTCFKYNIYMINAFSF